MPFIRQTSFLAGELAPFMWGRTDLRQYAHGLRQCKNFLITKHGSAVSRPGTRYIAPGKVTGFQRPPRLIPYIYSDTVSFVIELGHSTARFFSNGARLESPPGTPVEVTHGWTADQVWAATWSQSGAMLILTHRDLVPRVISRGSDGSWSSANISMEVTSAQWRTLPSQAVKTKSPRLLDDPEDYLFVESESNKALPWVWYVTAVQRQISSGVVYETRPQQVYVWMTSGGTETTLTDATNKIVLAPDHPVTLRRPDSSDADESPLDDEEVICYNFYRGLGVLDNYPPPDSFLVGYVGSTTGLDFVDDGRDPNYMIRPLVGSTKWELPYSSVMKYPTCSAFYQDRMVFGGCELKPATLNFSASGNYKDFDRRPVPYPTMALEFELASRFRERIKAMVALDKLVVLTDSSVWTIGPTQGPFSYDDVHAQVIDEVGSIGMNPIVMDGAVLFGRSKGLGIRMLVPSQERLGFSVVDVTYHASHLFRNPTKDAIQSWAHAPDPWGILWVDRVDSDGLMSGTRSGDSFGWVRHSTGETNPFSSIGRDVILSTCSIPEGGSDRVYLLVERKPSGSTAWGNYCVERMEDRQHLGASTDGASVDSCVQYLEAVTGTEIPVGTVFSGLDHLEGREVWLQGWNIPPQGPLTVVSGDVTTIAPIPKNEGDNARFYIGLAFTCEMETLDAPGAETMTRQKQLISIGFEVDQSKGLWVGQDSAHLVEWRQRTVGDGYAGVSAATELVKVMVRGTWGLAARAFLRQTEPLPVTVLGVLREVDIGG